MDVLDVTVCLVLLFKVFVLKNRSLRKNLKFFRTFRLNPNDIIEEYNFLL